MKVLITNNALAGHGGSETYVRDVAKALLKRGHEPIVYSTLLGEVAHELSAASITVVDDLNRLKTTPDLIHGHHHMETLTALLHFAGVPAIQICHSRSLWLEMPVQFPRILRYVAVDHTCRDRLRAHGIPEERIRVLFNSVDLEKFRRRSHSLPLRPGRALVFSNYAAKNTHLRYIREACQHARIELDVIGRGADNPKSQPERLLGDYDLVFAKARCALEAMAVGAAVILCDASGTGPMVDTKNFDELRPLNFGVQTLRDSFDIKIIAREINRYDPQDAAAVSAMVRGVAGHETMVDQLVDLYRKVIEEYRTFGNSDMATEGRAAAAYLRQLKLDFARHGAASMRMRERVERLPLVGKLGVKLAQRLTRP